MKVSLQATFLLEKEFNIAEGKRFRFENAFMSIFNRNKYF